MTTVNKKDKMPHYYVCICTLFNHLIFFFAIQIPMQCTRKKKENKIHNIKKYVQNLAPEKLKTWHEIKVMCGELSISKVIERQLK